MGTDRKSRESALCAEGVDIVEECTVGNLGVAFFWAVEVMLGTPLLQEGGSDTLTKEL